MNRTGQVWEDEFGTTVLILAPPTVTEHGTLAHRVLYLVANLDDKEEVWFEGDPWEKCGWYTRLA